MSESNKPQIDLWNGRVGAKWAAMHVNLDAMLAVATQELTARAGSVAGQRVLDIGCGSGETCAAWLAAGADVTGVDVSEAMLAVAAMRTKGQARLIQADASAWSDPAAFDLAVSQFGLMFFADPAAAFKNIAGNVRAGGRLLFTCWRAEAENQWVSVPMAAICDLLPEGAPAQPQAPGPFALADKVRLAALIEGAGFEDVRIDAFDFPVCVAREGGVEAAVRFIMQIGPTGAALGQTDETVRAAAKARLRTTLAAFDKDGFVALGGALWVVAAVRAAR